MKRLIVFLVGMLFVLSAFAAQDVAVSGAWARATAPGQDSAMVAMNLTSSRDARLVAVAVGKDVAEHAAIHTMKQQNGMMLMREVDSLALPAGHEVSLGAGDHIMLTGLRHPLKEGTSVALKLTVEFANKQRETFEVKAPIRKFAPSGMDGMRNMGGMRNGY
jgi:periplasmic copper chaperone A